MFFIFIKGASKHSHHGVWLKTLAICLNINAIIHPQTYYIQLLEADFPKKKLYLTKLILNPSIHASLETQQDCEQNVPMVPVICMTAQLTTTSWPLNHFFIATYVL